MMAQANSACAEALRPGVRGFEGVMTSCGIVSLEVDVLVTADRYEFLSTKQRELILV